MTAFILTLCMALIAYSYVGYPVVLWILSWLRPFRPHPQTQRGLFQPTVTVLICAYNEEHTIQQKLENTLNWHYPLEKLQILVASESSDATDEVVQRYQSRGITLLSMQPREGKQPSIYKAMSCARGDIVVFTDANALVDPDSLQTMVRHFADPQVGCVSGQLQYVSTTTLGSAVEEGTYWRYEEAVKTLESKIGSLLGANGSLYALRRDLYYPLSKYRGDDFELPIGVLLRGYRAILERSARSYEGVPDSARSSFERRIRIISWVWPSSLILCWQALAHRKLLVLFQIVSHKIIRWLVPVLMSVVLLANLLLLDSFWFRILLAGQALFYLGAVAGAIIKRTRPKPQHTILTGLAYFVLSNVAALLALLRALSGSAANTWER